MDDRYGNTSTVNPGSGKPWFVGHSHTVPIICRHPSIVSAYGNKRSSANLSKITIA
jgi:hypothetical protein